MVGSLFKSLARFWATDLRYRWSKIRHRGSLLSTHVREDLYPETVPALKETAVELHKNFVYVRDGFLRLYDSIDTPANCWNRAFNPGPLKDDCDGFHAALYWAACKNFECYLVTIVSTDIVKSHTALWLPRVGIMDYTRLHEGDDLNLTVEKVKKSRHISGIFHVELSKWAGDRWGSHEIVSMEQP